MKVYQYEVDWKEDWDLKTLNKLAKLVGGKKCLQEYSQDVVDAKVMYISSRQLTYDEMDQLWEKAELWGFGDPVEGRTFEEILEVVQYLNNVELMREDLVNYSEDYMKGNELKRYSRRMWKASADTIVKEYKRRLGDKKPYEDQCKERSY